MLLCEKYTPFTLNGIAGNSKAVERLMEFGIEAQKGAVKKPLLVYGPAGTGKTTAVHALAASHGFELLELNAGDYRDTQTLNRELMPASASRGIFNKKLLILLDEIDDLSGKYDAGAEAVINQLIKNSRHPIIFIADDMWSRKIAFLREKVEPVEFKRVSTYDILDLMKKILKKEKKEVGQGTLDEIAERSNGDIRGALNDLEFMIGSDPKLIENLGMRNRKLEIFGVLDQIFTSESFERARMAAMDADVDLSMLVNWVAENIPIRYTEKVEAYRAFSVTADAGFYIEKANRTNYYGYLRYSSALLSGGVAIANNGAVSTIRRYAFPAAIRYLSKTKKERNIRGEIISRLIYKVHSGKRDVIDSCLPMLKIVASIGKKEEGMEAVLNFFENKYAMGKDEVEYLMHET